ncbi:thioredoxin family protein [Alkaliphilus crotonatoxidans]
MTFRELFMLGCSFEAFVDKDQDINREKTLEILENIILDEEIIHKISAIRNPVYILAFAEIWCPDCMINVPALKKMATINPLIEFKILPRDEYESYLTGYRLGGKVKIPTFIIFNEKFEELGHFIETPKVLREMVAKGNELEVVVAKRKYRKGEYVKETINEIINIILKK